MRLDHLLSREYSFPVGSGQRERNILGRSVGGVKWTESRAGSQATERSSSKTRITSLRQPTAHLDANTNFAKHFVPFHYPAVKVLLRERTSGPVSTVTCPIILPVVMTVISAQLSEFHPPLESISQRAMKSSMSQARFACPGNPPWD